MLGQAQPNTAYNFSLYMQDLHVWVLHTVQKFYVHVWYLLGLARPNKQAAPKPKEYTFHVIQERITKTLRESNKREKIEGELDNNAARKWKGIEKKERSVWQGIYFHCVEVKRVNVIKQRSSASQKFEQKEKYSNKKEL